MRADFPASDAVGSIERRGLPGIRISGKGEDSRDGDVFGFKLTLSSGEEQDFFRLTVRMDGDVARFIVSKDGDSAEGRLPKDRMGLPGEVTVGTVMAYETIPTADGMRECTLCTASGNGISFLAWVDDGIAYRTIHESAGYRLCLDIESLP